MTDTELEFVKRFIAEHPIYIKNMLARQNERKEELDRASAALHGKTISFVVQDIKE